MRKFYLNENGFIEQPEWSPRCWIDVQAPDEADLGFLREDMGIPADFIESIADPDERPRVERDGGWRLTIVRIPIKVKRSDAPYVTIPLGIISNDEVIATICFHANEQMKDYIEHTRIKGISVSTELDFVLRIIFSTAFWYLKYLKTISNAVTRKVRSLEKSVRNEDLLDLLQVQNTLVFFNTSIEGDRMLLSRLEHVYGKDYDTDLFEDVDIELRQADNTAKIYSDILESTMDTFASVISNNVNAIMKKMTAVSIVLMIPTLVASFYGMNVAITYGNNPYVFFLIVGGSLMLSGILYFWLRKIKWF